jgi:hypothetical protein
MPQSREQATRRWTRSDEENDGPVTPSQQETSSLDGEKKEWTGESADKSKLASTTGPTAIGAFCDRSTPKGSGESRRNDRRRESLGKEKERPGQLATEMGNGKSSTLATLAGTYPGRSSSWGRKLHGQSGQSRLGAALAVP